MRKGDFAICKRLRDLFNRITVSDVRFDPPVGPEIFQSNPEGKFQTQVRITFELYDKVMAKGGIVLDSDRKVVMFSII